jgi:hypothetical protein
MDYENKSDWTLGKNKPNTKPIQTQSNPIKPNLPDAQMSVNSILTKNYERNDIFAVPENKANSNPIKANFKDDDGFSAYYTRDCHVSPSAFGLGHLGLAILRTADLRK